MDSMSPLTLEYCRKFDSRLLWILKLTGYFRFATRGEEIIYKTAITSILRCVITIFLSNFSALYMFYVTYIRDKFLIISEVLILALCALLQNVILVNIAVPNRNSALILLNFCIETDTLFGVKDTKFMRTIAVKIYLFLTIFIGSFQAIIVIVLILAYRTPISVHVVGSIYFGLLFFIFYDYCFLVTFYIFLALRVHYFNVAIIKKAGINAEYFPKQFFFDEILWKNKYDNLVTFHNFARSQDFVEAIKIIFKLLRQLEKCYRFTIFMGMSAITLGTFLCVPSIITLSKSAEFNTLRMGCAIGWVLLGWIFEYGLGLQSDLFCRQIDETKLICTYIQLKPTSSGEILNLTRSIIHTLKIREPRLSVYGMYFLNTGLVLRIAASIFIYITVQLQILVPA